MNAAFVEKISLLKLTMKDGQRFNVSPLELPKIKKALAKNTT